MGKNKGKGGKNRRRGKNDNDDERRELIFKEEGQGTSGVPGCPSRSEGIWLRQGLSAWSGVLGGVVGPVLRHGPVVCVPAVSRTTGPRFGLLPPPPRRGAAGDLCVCCLHCTGGVLTGFSLECSVILFPLPLSYGFRFCVSEYAQVLRMLGNGRCESACFDSVKRLCHIRGKLRKKVWVNAGDIVLIGLREYQDEKADIILKYTADEARSLKQYGEIPDTTTIHENAEGGEGEDGEEGVVFEFDDIDEI